MRRWFLEWCQTGGQTPSLALSEFMVWCQTTGQTPVYLPSIAVLGLTYGLTRLYTHPQKFDHYPSDLT